MECSRAYSLRDIIEDYSLQNYDKTSETYQIHQRINNNILENISKGISLMKKESKNGFRELTLNKQLDTLQKRSHQIRDCLEEGFFEEEEFKIIYNNIRKKIRNIYKKSLKEITNREESDKYSVILF